MIHLNSFICHKNYNENDLTLSFRPSSLIPKVLKHFFFFRSKGRSIVLQGHNYQTSLFHVKSINHSFESSSTTFACIPARKYEDFFRRFIPIFDMLLVVVIPFLLLCLTNIGILLFTMRNNRHMREYGQRLHRRHQRLTIMLLSVTLAFIGLTCPSVIFICVNKIVYFENIVTEDKRDQMQLIVDICEALWYTKHAMNFILYTLNGQDFRREFLRLFTRDVNRRSNLRSSKTLSRSNDH